jgi:hypothetical protein
MEVPPVQYSISKGLLEVYNEMKNNLKESF